MSKKAFITGANGQDGSFLVEYLLSLNYEVYGMVRRSSQETLENLREAQKNPNFHLVMGNMTDCSSLWKLLNKIQPDEIYNLAAQSHVHNSFDVAEETVDVDGMGTLRLLNAFREVCPKAKFYQASSSEMFGDNPVNPQDETTELCPASPYACAKVFSHNICKNYRTAYGLFICSGILFNHESERRNEKFVTRKITLAAARIAQGRQKTLELGNLTAYRDWGYAKEYVVAMHRMLQQQIPDDYVIATGQTHSVREFLEEVFSLAGLDINKHVVIREDLFRPHEVPYLLGDPSKARAAFGWQPKTTMKELAKIMYDHDWNRVCNEV